MTYGETGAAGVQTFHGPSPALPPEGVRHPRLPDVTDPC